MFQTYRITLESGIDVGQGINVGRGKFGKKNNRRAGKNLILGESNMLKKKSDF